jgi:DNA-binding transcriptional LysR family regulator
MSNLDRLIRFAAVAEEMSFSRAAERLHVDQPWLSRQIQQLEASLGFPLFVRNTRKVALTTKGEILLSHAAKLADVAKTTHDVCRRLDREQTSTIAFGMNPHSYWVPARKHILDAFGARYPLAHIEPESNSTTRLFSKLRSGRLDVVLARATYDHEDLESCIVHRSRRSLLAPAEHPLAQHKSVSLEALAGQRIAVTNPHLNARTFALNYGPFLDAGAEAVVVVEGQSAIAYYASVDRLIRLCLGWPHSDTMTPSDFVHIEIETPLPDIEYELARRRESSTILVEGFWKVAREISASLLQPANLAVNDPAAFESRPRARAMG